MDAGKKEQNSELQLTTLPFNIGVVDSPENKGLPVRWPFTLEFDENSSIIVQKYSAETDKVLEEAYKKGSLLSISLGEGSFGVKKANDALKHILSVCDKSLTETSFLEVGCGKGYLLYRLKQQGAQKVMGCEPGPAAITGSEEFNIEIKNNFFTPNLLSDRFDVVFSYGVLEHVQNPKQFLESQIQVLNEQGKLLVAVPNSQTKLQLGDMNILAHEHWNYFTEQSVKNLLVRCGLSKVDSAIGINGAMIYAWGEKSQTDRTEEEVDDTSEKQLFSTFVAQVKESLALLQEKINDSEKQGKSVGLYGGGLNVFGLLNHSSEPRFFDGDIEKHGKYYPGFNNPIENPNNLLDNPVDEIWIMALDYDEEITNYLKNELKLPDNSNIFSFNNFLEGITLDIIKSSLTQDNNDNDNNVDNNRVGQKMHDLMKELYPLCRSITGDGVRETLKIIQKHIPLEIKEVPSSTQVFDWTVPKEWNIWDAYVKNSQGEKVIDFKQSNLHVLGYSVPVNQKMRLSELKEHLFTVPEHPDWIPYLTSYYQENWGFCLSQKQYDQLEEDTYEVIIDSTLEPGSLTFGELYLPGETDEEILLTCYTCHPSLCNDSLSGVVLLTILAETLKNQKHKYSYRFLFVPETIGTISWLSLNENKTGRIKHGLVVTCVGDRGKFIYKKSRIGQAKIDLVAEKVLMDSGVDYSIQEFAPFGSDERQYCSPGFNLPVGSLIRTDYRKKFPEYHTSADNLDYVRPENLLESLEKYQEILFVLENDGFYLNLNPKCEPQLGKRGIYRSLGGQKISKADDLALFWVLNFSDGQNSLLDIARRSEYSFPRIKKAADVLLQAELIQKIN